MRKNLFVDEKLRQESFAEFESMRRDCRFCDIIVNFGSYQISAHKVVLAAALPYLVDVLENSTSDCQRKEVSLEDVESNVLESLINYSYTGTIEITTENVESILHGACALRVSRVRDACCDFMENLMNCENVLGILQFAFNLDCDNLMEKADNYICENFEAVCKSEHFLKLPFYILKHIIRKDNLKVRNEDPVLRAVLNWAKMAPLERENYFRNLLGDIRIIYLTQRYYDEVAASEEVVRQVLSVNRSIQQGALSLPENEKLRLCPEIRPRSSLRDTDKYGKSVYVLSSIIVLFVLVSTGGFSWFIGCFVVLALDNRFRLVEQFSAVAHDRNIVKYIVIVFMIVLLVKSPLKFLVLLLTKSIVSYVFKNN